MTAAQITDSEARAMALQGIVEIARGVDYAIAEIRAGRFMRAQETLLLAKAGAIVAEAAIQKVRTPAALIAEAVEEARGEAWNEGEYAGREYQKRLHTYAHWSYIGVFPEPFVNPYRARIARGEVSP